MGIFDIFGTGDQQAAAQAQIAGINAGTTAATGNINSGIGAITSDYSSALLPFMQNYGQAQSGVTKLGDALGLNGPNGNASATQALQATPGYSFTKNAGEGAVNAAAAANGTLGSGNQAVALSNYDSGLASTTYNNYVNQLQPFLGASNAAATGAAGVNTGMGNALAGQYGNLAGLNYTSATGIGNANANADLAGLTASGNIMNLIGSLGGAAMGGFGGLGGSLGSMLGGTAGSAISGGGAFAGPTSYGGPNGPTPLTGGTAAGNMFGSVFSDERLKEDIEPVGSLYDGTNVYRYRYIGDDTPRIGVMAQEVEKSRPDAVTEVGGFKAVNYAKATDLAASLARFVDDNVVQLDDRRAKSGHGYASDLSRFLEAA